jgi:hypothetical protein
MILPSMPESSEWSLSIRSSHQNSAYISPVPMRATCPAHHIFLDLIKLIIYGEQYRSFHASMRGLLQSPVTSSPLSSKSSSSRKFLDYVYPWMLQTNLYAHTNNMQNYISVYLDLTWQTGGQKITLLK